MVKKKIAVQRKAEVETLLVNTQDGETLFFTHGGYKMPTAEEFAEKYKLKAVDGKLMLVEKI